MAGFERVEQVNEANYSRPVVNYATNMDEDFLCEPRGLLEGRITRLGTCRFDGLLDNAVSLRGYNTISGRFNFNVPTFSFLFLGPNLSFPGITQDFNRNLRANVLFTCIYIYISNSFSSLLGNPN